MMVRALMLGYLALLSVLACYGAYRYYLLLLYHRVKASPPRPLRRVDAWPRVTIQIPVYNERYVVERAIRSACAVDYPSELLEVQILDDSTDDTPALIEALVAEERSRGRRIVHRRRAHRRHFKAGALADGLEEAGGEFVAVFDADFVIPKDFLRRTVPFFGDPAVGMVQARWGHLNARYSFLTCAQAVLLDGHFAVEQVARHGAGRFFNFNGTAGIWRAAAIRSAGGWQADTLTEDLDLSYRAQLAGWRCVYVPDLVAPAELPVEIHALKSQQYRWTKGSIQTAKKLLPRILASRVPWRIKFDSFFHLTSFFTYPVALLAGLGLPLFVLGVLPSAPHYGLTDLIWLLLLPVPAVCFYFCAQRSRQSSWLARATVLPGTLALGMGLLVNNARAVVDGWFDTGSSEFVRTTKFGVRIRSDRWQTKAYRARGTSTEWMELILAAYFALGCWAALTQKQFVSLAYAVLFCLGFTYVGWLSLWQRLPATPRASRLPLRGSRQAGGPGPAWLLRGSRVPSRVLDELSV